MIKLLFSNKKLNLSNDFVLNNMKFLSSSSSIIREPNNNSNYLILFRCNYKFYEKMLNLICKVDNNLNLLENKLINYNVDKLLSINNNLQIVNDGFEDIRLFVHNNLIYYIGEFSYNLINKNNYNYFKDRKYNLVSGIFNENQEFKVNEIEITFPTDYKIEKNWVFFDYKTKLSVIYRWFPLQICEIDYDEKKLYLKEEKIMPDIFNNISGSSCGIKYDNLIWFIVHSHTNRNYLHMIVAFDEEMNLIKYSELFKFEGQNIEFSYGLLIENNEFIITYSINDKSSHIAFFNYNYIKNDIKWTLNYTI